MRGDEYMLDKLRSQLKWSKKKGLDAAESSLFKQISWSVHTETSVEVSKGYIMKGVWYAMTLPEGNRAPMEGV